MGAKNLRRALVALQGFKKHLSMSVKRMETDLQAKKKKITKQDKATIEEEALEIAKTSFFKGEEYTTFRNARERRQYLSASVMERSRCRLLVQLYDQQVWHDCVVMPDYSQSFYAMADKLSIQPLIVAGIRHSAAGTSEQDCDQPRKNDQGTRPPHTCALHWSIS